MHPSCKGGSEFEFWIHNWRGWGTGCFWLLNLCREHLTVPKFLLCKKHLLRFLLQFSSLHKWQLRASALLAQAQTSQSSSLSQPFNLLNNPIAPFFQNRSRNWVLLTTLTATTLAKPPSPMWIITVDSRMVLLEGVRQALALSLWVPPFTQGPQDSTTNPHPSKYRLSSSVPSCLSLLCLWGFGQVFVSLAL